MHWNLSSIFTGQRCEVAQIHPHHARFYQRTAPQLFLRSEVCCAFPRATPLFLNVTASRTRNLLVFEMIDLEFAGTWRLLIFWRRIFTPHVRVKTMGTASNKGPAQEKPDVSSSLSLNDVYIVEGYKTCINKNLGFFFKFTQKLNFLHLEYIHFTKIPDM